MNRIEIRSLKLKFFTPKISGKPSKKFELSHLSKKNFFALFLGTLEIPVFLNFINLFLYQKYLINEK